MLRINENTKKTNINNYIDFKNNEFNIGVTKVRISRIDKIYIKKDYLDRDELWMDGMVEIFENGKWEEYIWYKNVRFNLDGEWGIEIDIYDGERWNREITLKWNTVNFKYNDIKNFI